MVATLPNRLVGNNRQTQLLLNLSSRILAMMHMDNKLRQLRLHQMLTTITARCHLLQAIIMVRDTHSSHQVMGKTSQVRLQHLTILKPMQLLLMEDQLQLPSLMGLLSLGMHHLLSRAPSRAMEHPLPKPPKQVMDRLLPKLPIPVMDYRLPKLPKQVMEHLLPKLPNRVMEHLLPKLPNRVMEQLLPKLPN